MASPTDEQGGWAGAADEATRTDVRVSHCVALAPSVVFAVRAVEMTPGGAVRSRASGAFTQTLITGATRVVIVRPDRRPSLLGASALRPHCSLVRMFVELSGVVPADREQRAAMDHEWCGRWCGAARREVTRSHESNVIHAAFSRKEIFTSPRRRSTVTMHYKQWSYEHKLKN